MEIAACARVAKDCVASALPLSLCSQRLLLPHRPRKWPSASAISPAAARHPSTTAGRLRHRRASASMSVISLLVGIAIDRELIKSADEPVVKYFPDYAMLKSPGWDNVTLRHLLTMSSGIQWDENRAWKDPQNDEPRLGNEADPFRYVLSKPIAAPPDTVWNYNGGGTDLLGNVIERVSGKPLEAF